MKLLKSDKAMVEKFRGGKTKTTNRMTTEEAEESYEAYPDGLKCDGTETQLIINDEEYFLWVSYPDTPSTTEDFPKHIQKGLGGKKRKPFHFDDELEQERYEWFCGGWTRFYDDILRPKELGGKEHKLFFCWNTKAVAGVSIYINEENVQDPRLTCNWSITRLKDSYFTPHHRLLIHQ
jgi:hypothetical protein